METATRPAPDTGGVPLYEARDIVKRYGHVEALRGASFAAYAGEVTALIGDNGAGKSTLVKILSGAERPDSGSLLLDGKPIALSSPQDAHRHGIETVYQDLSLATDMDPAANIFMGREILRRGLLGKLGFIDKGAMRRQGIETFQNLKADIKDADAPVAALSGGQRQSVSICRSFLWARRVMFMDEPTAALGVVQTQRTLDLIRRIRDTGIAVVLISHNMSDVTKVADRIEVLRLGCRVARFSNADTSIEELVGAMTGAMGDGSEPVNKEARA
ncbi:MAG: sugar ABC transporter ATP-binding protein [Rhizobiales bacterium]|nr:sugar ABC transporter ATP-binding protein [Hyphomicrobiales bacterium]OJY02043.1 MAG: sugar ABC transporter ATP-binding protein [Rhizobiales bacterium 63-22]